MTIAENHPPETRPNTEEELLAQGWTAEQASFLAKFDAACQGQDATLVIPVTIFALENITKLLTPDSQRAVAALVSESAFRMGQEANQTDKELAAIKKAANEIGDDGAVNPDADHPPGPASVQ